MIDLFVTFFPFIGVIAYAGTIIDERKDGYCYQIIQKRGFHSYYWSHFVASGLLGGLLAVAILISLYLLTDIGIGQNPLWKDAMQVYLTPEFGSIRKINFVKNNYRGIKSYKWRNECTR